MAKHFGEVKNLLVFAAKDLYIFSSRYVLARGNVYADKKTTRYI